MKRHDLGTLFGPRSIAVVGASSDPSAVGGRLVAHLRRHPFPGRLLLVNPKHPVIAGLPAVASVAALSEVPDVAVVALPAGPAVDAVEELAGLGVPNVVLVASGFEETSTAGGRSLAWRLWEASRTLNLVGPNSQGLWSVPADLVLAFGSEAERDGLVAGPVGIVAHSGSLGGAVIRRLQDSGVGLRYAVSSGNESGLTMADYLEFFLDDGGVGVVGLYIEAVREGERLLAVLDRAQAAGVDVVALHAGLSARAQQMTASHTGRMAAAPRRYSEVLTQHGVLVVPTVGDLVAAISLLAGTDRRIPARGSVGMLGISGGMLALMADACDAEGFTLPTLTDATRRRLRQRLPNYAALENPVDLTSAVLRDEASLPDCIAAVADDPGVDAVVVGLDNKGYGRLGPLADDLVAIGDRSAKPLVLALWDGPAARSPELELRLLRSAVVVTDEPAAAARRLRDLRVRPARTGGALPELGPVGPAAALRTWPGAVDFAGAVGLSVPDTVVLAPGEPLSPADFRRFPGPVVVKALPGLVEHKTDRGLVLTGITTHEEAAAAVAKISAEAGPDVPVLIQEQVRGVEVLLAATLDPDWGPVLTVGTGGTLVELLDDSLTVSIPCSADALSARLEGLRLHRLLAGHRGEPPADVDALLTVALGLQAVFRSGAFSEVELNPVLVGPRGGGVFFVDLLARAR